MKNMKNTDKIARYFECEMRASRSESNEYVIEGRPVVYEQHTDMGWFDEVIKNGALNNTDIRDVCLLGNHNADTFPLARTKNGKGTMTLSKDDEGLFMRAVLDCDNNPSAQEAYSAVQRGDVTGMSFAFRVASKGDTWKWDDNDYGWREINDISIIHEVSLVNWPAYDGTSASTRSKQEEEALATFKEMKEERSRKAKEAVEIERLRNINRSK